MTAETITAGDGCPIAFRWDGDASLPVLLLSNSIATDHRMWDSVVPDLTKVRRVLRYDTRGHGASGAPRGAYSLDRLGRDVIELLDALHISMATERTVKRPDGSIERTTTCDRTVVIERRGGGAGAIVALVIGLLAVVVIGYFLMNMSQSEQIESNAIAGAAESVGTAAENVGEAARSVTPAGQ